MVRHYLTCSECVGIAETAWNLTSEAFIVINKEGNIFKLNAPAREMLGKVLTRPLKSNNNFFEIINESGFEELSHNVKSTATLDEVSEFNFSLGKNNFYSFQIYSIDQGSRILIKFRRVAGKSTVEKLKILDELIGESKDAVMLLKGPFYRDTTKIGNHNGNFLNYFGFAENELIGQDIHKLFGPKTDYNALKRFFRQLADGYLASLTLVNYSKRGKEMLNHWYCNPVFDDLGEVMYAVCVIRNIVDESRPVITRGIGDIEKIGAIIQGQEYERSRIARDLHDGMGQLLNGIKLRLAQCNVDNLETEKVKIENLLLDSIVELEKISEDLLPSKLRSFNLDVCLRSLVDSIVELDTVFESSGNFNIIPEEIKTHLYRITQEVINNAIKHAKAFTISIQLHVEKNRVTMTFEDDGQGFDINKLNSFIHEGHFGLHNISDRVIMLGGEIEIDSNESLGTFIHIEVPIF